MEVSMRILVVDDEQLIRSVICEYCRNAGYDVREASNGRDALTLLLKESYDLLILDIMMPVMDGFSMLKELPKERHIPTIILSARGEEYDKLSGFDLGIDDYVTKPFSPKELLARVNAVLTRSGKKSSSLYTLDTLEVNEFAHTLKIDGKLISITPKEYEILTYLIHNKGIAISRGI